MVSCLQIAGCCPKNANHCLGPWNQEQAKDSGTGTAPHCSPSLQHTVLGGSGTLVTLVHKDTTRESDEGARRKAMLEPGFCELAELPFGGETPNPSPMRSPRRAQCAAAATPSSLPFWCSGFLIGMRICVTHMLIYVYLYSEDTLLPPRCTRVCARTRSRTELAGTARHGNKPRCCFSAACQYRTAPAGQRCVGVTPPTADPPPRFGTRGSPGGAVLADGLFSGEKRKMNLSRASSWGCAVCAWTEHLSAPQAPPRLGAP